MMMPVDGKFNKIEIRSIFYFVHETVGLGLKTWQHGLIGARLLPIHRTRIMAAID